MTLSFFINTQVKIKLKKIKIPSRGKTDLDTYRKGTKYCIHETTMNEYVTDLITNHPRSKSRYLAALNIKRAIPEIAAESHVPKFVKSHKVHAGPFIWLARKGMDCKRKDSDQISYIKFSEAS